MHSPQHSPFPLHKRQKIGFRQIQSQRAHAHQGLGELKQSRIISQKSSPQSCWMGGPKVARIRIHPCLGPLWIFPKQVIEHQRLTEIVGNLCPTGSGYTFDANRQVSLVFDAIRSHHLHFLFQRQVEESPRSLVGCLYDGLRDPMPCDHHKPHLLQGCPKSLCNP
jgi:hypothetical protein